MTKSSLRLRGLAAALTACCGFAAHAQWQTQSMTLKPGWNAVYLHVDASHVSLDTLLGSTGTIDEIWLWQTPASQLQFVKSPQEPITPNSQWAVWNRSPGNVDTFTQFRPNAAYLVRNSAATNTVWNLVGKPVLPRYEWTTTGQNFIGFPTPAGAPPSFEKFLDQVPALALGAELFRYAGGPMSPVPVPALVYPSIAARRGEAFWMRAKDYNAYFGPLGVSLQSGGNTVDFGSRLGTYSVRLKNNSDLTNTFTLSLLPSGDAPSGQPGSVGVPPLLIRGPRSAADLAHLHTTLTTSQVPTDHQVTLTPRGKPGSEVEVVLGLNRSAMSSTVGDRYAGILRFADTNGLSQIDVGVAATVADTAGLWVGDASVTQVAQYLVTYAKNADGTPLLAEVTTNGASYVAISTNTTMANVVRPVPLRLIAHNDSGGQARLLQRVFVGLNAANVPVLATDEAFLGTDNRDGARRISAAHLPFAHTNTPWLGTGQFREGNNVQFTVPLDYRDQASNPFLHTFHPDHDNLDARFSRVQVQGAESYTLERAITLAVTSPGTNFTSLTTSRDTLTGTYNETITVRGKGSSSRQFTLQGDFSLRRISNIPLLTVAP
jgi:hypothetical protein